MYLNSSTYESIEADVYELVDDFGLTEYPLSMVRVCERLQISLKPYSSLSPQTRHIAMEYSRDAFHTGGNYGRMANIAILYNDKQIPDRIRFSVAHEIGHIIRNLQGDGSSDEGEAEYYAGYFLAPDPLVYAHCPSLEVSNIRQTFHISEQAAKVARDHVVNRIRCRKPWRRYEYGIVEICSVKGVKKTLKEIT